MEEEKGKLQSALALFHSGVGECLINALLLNNP